MQALVVPNQNAKTLAALQWQDVPTPAPGADEVLIEVKAVGLNPVDAKVVARSNAAWQYPHVLGLDVAGVVVAVGANVSAFAAGDHVCGHGDLAQPGCFAELVVGKADALALIPLGVDFATAAASLCAGLTAYQSLHRKANLAAARTILIHAGAGGVGSMAIQLAKLAGLKVVTTVSAAKRDFVAKLGPERIIDYHQEDVTAVVDALTGGLGVDIVLNTIGHPEADLPRLAFNGQLLCVLDTPEMVPAELALTVAKINLGGAHRCHDSRQVQALGEMTQELLALVASRQVDPLVTKTLPFAEIPSGLAALQAAQVMGKWVAVV
ncbi:alcohol dehydrogenase catalytic domain-containing protein [Lacticaseibacillus sp. GG6-2]